MDKADLLQRISGNKKIGILWQSLGILKKIAASAGAETAWVFRVDASLPWIEGNRIKIWLPCCLKITSK